MKDAKGCNFIMPEAVCFKVTEANSIKMLFSGIWKPDQEAQKGKSKHVFNW